MMEASVALKILKIRPRKVAKKLGYHQSRLNKSNAQISVRAFSVAKKAQQFEFDWSNLNFDQSGGRFSNSL